MVCVLSTCRYQWLDEEDLKALPVRELARPGALVVVWVTNKRRLAHLVKESLFPAWMVNFVGEWTWLKVRVGLTRRDGGILGIDACGSLRPPFLRSLQGESLCLTWTQTTRNHMKH